MKKRKRISKKEARRIAILKWKYLVEDPDARHFQIIGAVPETKDHLWTCPYCTMYFKKKGIKGFCAGCPGRVRGLSCFETGHPYDTFTLNKCTETAQKVLDTALSIDTGPIFVKLYKKCVRYLTKI